MPTPRRPAHVSFDFTFQKPESSESTEVDHEDPLRIAILGDFGGSSGGESAPRAVRVDVDNFDAVCAQFGAALSLPAGAADALEMDLRLKSLDDFHPDRLLKNVPLLERLAQLRLRLVNPKTANEAASEVRELLVGGPANPISASEESKPQETDAETLARLLGGTPSAASAPSAPSAPRSVVDRLLEQAVSSTASATPSTEQVQLLATLDAELAARLRSLLHHPKFQALESAWRGLDFLVREVEENVEILAIDISREELERQLATGENLAATAVGRQVEQIAPFVILSPWSFGASDAAFLGQLARFGAACGTSMIAGGASALVGCASFGLQPDPHDWSATAGADLQAFAELRRAPESAHLGLAAPRFLLRLPYGPESDPIETFPFEELPGGSPHESYLWGSGAFLCGYQLIHAFSGDGWEMDLGGISGEIGGLPMHSFEAGGETQVKPCAEAWLTDRAADAILSHGLMPLLSVRGSDSALLVSLRSISDPASALEFRR